MELIKCVILISFTYGRGVKLPYVWIGYFEHIKLYKTTTET